MYPARDLESRHSSSSAMSDTVCTPRHGNCMELIHNLYRELEPQMSESYRPHVKYIPSPSNEVKNFSVTDRTVSDKGKKGKPLKATQIVISAVSEMQKRRESAVNENPGKSKFKDIVRKASDKNLKDLDKEASQSLPNLATATES